MYTDIFDRIRKSTGGPIGQYREKAEGYFAFPKLEGELGPNMRFNGQDVLCWSLNNYLGLANHPEIRKADAEAAAAHKQTEHYNKWREEVAPYMASPRKAIPTTPLAWD